MQDINVRKAIGFGIDRNEILHTLYTDNWKPAQNIVTKNFPGYTDRGDAVRFDPNEAIRRLKPPDGLTSTPTATGSRTATSWR